MLVFLGFFFWFEFEQTKLRHRFGQRCIWIESAVTRVLRTVASRTGGALVRDLFVKLRFVPGITNHLRKKRAGPNQEEWSTWRAVWEADVLFYIALGFLTLLFAFWHAKAAKQEMDKNERLPSNVSIYCPQSEPTQPPRPAGAEHRAAVSSSNDLHEPKKKKN